MKTPNTSVTPQSQELAGASQSQGKPSTETGNARLVNTHDQLRLAVELGIIPKEQAVAVSYSPRPSGRIGMAQCDHSIVYSPFFKTDPQGSAWYNYGDKAFTGNRASSFEKAKSWASEKYGITEWKPNRMRDHVPAIVQKKLPLPKRN